MRRHGRAIHAYLARRSARDTADDLLSEVFLRAYAARRQYDQRWHDARPWLYGIARNVLREHWRQAGATEPAGELLDLAASEDPWPDVGSRLDAAARLSGLRSALAQLGLSDRDVLLLVTWEGLTPTEAAVALGIPPGGAARATSGADTVTAILTAFAASSNDILVVTRTMSGDRGTLGPTIIWLSPAEPVPGATVRSRILSFSLAGARQADQALTYPASAAAQATAGPGCGTIFSARGSRCYLPPACEGG